MAETYDQKIIRLAASKAGYKMWRNNRGTAYQGKVLSRDGGFVMLGNPRIITFGVGGPGGSDLIGYKTITVTPDMVGQQIAVFTAIECKRSKGRITTTEDQKNFIGKVNDAGGVACVARKPEDIPS